MTLPPTRPIPSTLPQSLPSNLTVAQPSSLRPSGSPLARIRVLGCCAIPSSPPSTVDGSSSGLLRPVHLELISIASVLSLSRKQPCIFAESSSFGARVVFPRKPVEPFGVFVLAMASLVKRSDMDFSCMSGGRSMCTSGSFARGSRRPDTTAGESTLIGMSWVMVVSRCGRS